MEGGAKLKVATELALEYLPPKDVVLVDSRKGCPPVHPTLYYMYEGEEDIYNGDIRENAICEVELVLVDGGSKASIGRILPGVDCKISGYVLQKEEKGSILHIQGIFYESKNAGEPPHFLSAGMNTTQIFNDFILRNEKLRHKFADEGLLDLFALGGSENRVKPDIKSVPLPSAIYSDSLINVRPLFNVESASQQGAGGNNETHAGFLGLRSMEEEICAPENLDAQFVLEGLRDDSAELLKGRDANEEANTQATISGNPDGIGHDTSYANRKAHLEKIKNLQSMLEKTRID
eukprot:Nk52_evm4s434 gene=Nk52_evmTU4s434